VTAGATATNFFVHTPICCPSRSELVSGRYLHNIKVKPSEPQPKGGICMHINETKFYNNTFAAHLQSAGYTVGMFGKVRSRALPALRPTLPSHAALFHGRHGLAKLWFADGVIGWRRVALARWHGALARWHGALARWHGALAR
jgi:arylsulfatase A-like enzyme